LNKKGPQDRVRINLNEDWEVDWWANRFECTPPELRKAVKVAGDSVESLEKYFSKKH